MEPKGAQGPERIDGFELVVQKSVEFGKRMEQVHSMSVSDPIVADNFFSLAMHMDITMTGAGRVKMEEVCVYEVRSGKIVHDHFFYSPMPMPSNN